MHLLADILAWTSTLTNSLMPHGVCLIVEPELILGLLAFHLIIWIDYILISRSISRITRASVVAKDTVVASGFQWFVNLCGWTHFAAAVVLFIGGPAYWFMALILGMTAAVSSKVAWYLITNELSLIAAIGGPDG